MFGLRHAFDADHIAAIDNVVRKLMQDGKSPYSVGFFFSLGQSSIVVLASIVIAATAAAMQGKLDALHNIGGVIGTTVSALFLLVIGIANLFKPHARGLDGFLKVGAGGVWSKITLEKEAHFDERRCARANTFRSTGGVILCSSSAGIMLSARTLLTVWACQRPPRAAATPRAFSAAAMVRNDLASARCISRMTRRTFAARLRVGGDGFLRRPCGLCDLPATQLQDEPWCARASRLRVAIMPQRLPLGLEASQSLGPSSLVVSTSTFGLISRSAPGSCHG